MQSALGQDALATLYDPVAPEQGPSIADRLRSTVPAFAAQPISLWDYPEANAQAFFTGDGESSDAWQTQLDKLRGPRIVEHISGGDAPDITRYVDAPTQLIEVRISHLLGNVTESLRQYGSMRGADPKISPVNVIIRTDAVYWIAVCQYELDRFDAAAATARLALKSNQDDVRSRPMSSLLALCQARTERWTDAAATAAALSAAQPDAREAYLSRRWMAMAGETDDNPAPADTAAPSDAAAPASTEPQ